MQILKRFKAYFYAMIGMISMFSFGIAHANSQISLNLDTASIVSMISSAVSVISSIGMAMLSLAVVIKIFQWVRRMIGGG